MLFYGFKIHVIQLTFFIDGFLESIYKTIFIFKLLKIFQNNFIILFIFIMRK